MGGGKYSTGAPEPEPAVYILLTRINKKKIFPNMFPSTLNSSSKAPKNSLQLDQRWSLDTGTTVSALKAPLSVHFFVQLCRQNDQSETFHCFLQSSLKAFDNRFVIFFFSWIPFCWNFEFLPLNWKCAKWVKISGCKMNLTCSVGYCKAVNVQRAHSGSAVAQW